MLLREAAQQTVQLHNYIDKKGTYDWKHIKHDIKPGQLRVMKEDMSKRLATWDSGQKSKRRKQAEGGTKRGRSGNTDAVAVYLYGDCKKCNNDTDAEEALHRRIDEYETDLRAHAKAQVVLAWELVSRYTVYTQRSRGNNLMAECRSTAATHCVAAFDLHSAITSRDKQM
jgi:hypothetical protein